MAVDSNPIPKKALVVKAVRVLAWLAVGLFLVVYALAPRGVTVFWREHCIAFGPIVLAALTALIGYVVCIIIRRQVSFVYALIIGACLLVFGTSLGLSCD
jgi:hypothetical protein